MKEIPILYSRFWYLFAINLNIYAHLMQIMVEQTISDLNALIQSVAVLIGALLPIVVSILAYLKAHTNSQSIQKVVNTSEQVVGSLEATDKWVLEHQAQLTKLVEVASTDPNVKKWLEEHNMDINKMRVDLDNTSKEIKDLYDPSNKPPVTMSNTVDRTLSELDKKTKVTAS
jgi:hypothetical protein